MHLLVYSDFESGMKVMKYVIYHPNKFSHPDWVFAVSVLSLFTSFIFEAINLLILFSKGTVYLTIIAYITVDVLKGFTIFYFNSMESDTQNILREVLNQENGLEIKVTSKNFKGGKRMQMGMTIRLTVYKCIRLIYASAAFYFLPFLYLICQGVIDVYEINVS